MKRHSCLPFVLLLFLAIGVLAAILFIPVLAAGFYGPPSPYLSAWQRFSYSASLLWNAGDLTIPRDPNGPQQIFVIEMGESVFTISSHLQAAGLIRAAQTFRIYLIWTGSDTSVQAGNYELSPAMTAIQIAHALQDATPSEVAFVVLPGWRMEEIAASLPTSGLNITPEAFIAAVLSAPHTFDFTPATATAEGFLYPDAYILPRATNAQQLVETLVRNFSLHLTSDLREGFARQGLTVYQAVTLASIVQREAVKGDEAPTIASVYLNRLKIGMKLDADPTVQYALGFNSVQQTWWTNPLSLEDLQVQSPYNTYLNTGFPPTPISNPSLSSLQAIANPAQTVYYYFRAQCDGTGRHAFAETFEQHIQNTCP
ncbi:MAG: endolytic transglycosylase MltG [Anaerolineales bacterium]|nr:endolytic transglycosylase MltG [Anaerolineales bacterium]